MIKINEHVRQMRKMLVKKYLLFEKGCKTSLHYYLIENINIDLFKHT